MNFFVIADVHGCLHTFRELLTHWRPAEETLVQLGDLVDRGNYSPETVELCRQLSLDFPAKTVFLQGNHDWAMAEHIGPERPLQSVAGLGRPRHAATVSAACGRLAGQPTPFGWGTGRFFGKMTTCVFSHAGFAEVADPLDPHQQTTGCCGGAARCATLGQLQVVGHSPTKSHRPERDGNLQHHLPRHGRGRRALSHRPAPRRNRRGPGNCCGAHRAGGHVIPFGKIR